MSITQKPGHDGGQEQNDDIGFEGPAVVAVVVLVAEAGQHAVGHKQRIIWSRMQKKFYISFGSFSVIFNMTIF